MKKLSVIVPVYNVEKYLGKCLDSLVNQNFEDYEIIVINDGTPDNSQVIIDEYSKKYPEVIKSYIKENGGLSSARNYGLEQSNSEYVSFVDSDDYVDSDYLKLLYEKAISNDYDIVVCDMEGIEENNNHIQKGINIMSDDINKNFLLSPPSAPNKLYKRQLFNKEIVFPEGLYYEDLGTIPKLLKYVNKIGYIDKPLYKYVNRDGSIMHQQKYNPKIADIFVVLETIYNFYLDNGILELYKDEIEYLYINQLIHIFGLKFLEYEESYPLIAKIKIEIYKKFPNWKKNKYFKKDDFKKRVMCKLIYKNKIKIINFLKK